MSTQGPPDSPWSKARIKSEDKRTREQRAARESDRPTERPRGGDAYGARPRVEAEPRAAPSRSEANESRLFGVNACLAMFRRRPEDLRKVWLTEARIADLKPVLAWCVQQRLGYRVVETGDLDRLAGTQHHEGVCFDVARRDPLSLSALLSSLPVAPAPACVVVLDGVGNPHNFGAVLRSAANFGIGGIVLPADSSLGLSGAAVRVAEGGAEAVALARAASGEAVENLLRAAGFTIAATVPREGRSPYAQALPARLALVFGAETAGMDTSRIGAADLRLTIPGTGAVESLNIAASAAVLFAEWYARHS